MYNVSADYKEQIWQSGKNKHFRAEVHFFDESVLMLDDSDVIGPEFFQVTHGATRPNQFDLGMAAMRMAVITLNNHEGKFDDKDFRGAVFYTEVGLELDLYDEVEEEWYKEIEWVNTGKFTVDKPIARSKIMRIQMVDDMYKFEKSYKDSTLVYPATLLQIWQNACSECNVLTNTSSFLNSGVTVQKKPVGDHVSYRDIVGMIAQLSKSFAFITRQGYIELDWFELDPVNGYMVDTYFDINVQMVDFIVSGVEFTYDQTTYVFGDETNIVVQLGENLLLDGDNYTATLTALASSLVGFQFRPFSAMILLDFALDIGDALIVKDTDGVEHSSTLTNFSMGINKHATISGDSETIFENQASSYSPLSRIRTIIGEQLDADTTAYEDMVLKVTTDMMTSKGFYVTTVEGEDGRVLEYYIHNEPTLAGSMIITKITSAGIGLSTDGGVTYSTAITTSGAAIPELASRIISAELIRVGVLEAGRITVGSGSTFEESQDFTWEDYGEMTWNELVDHFS